MESQKQFLADLQQLVSMRASSMNLVDTMAFVSEVAERLEEDPVFGEYQQIEYSGIGYRQKSLKVHGFTELDEADGSIGLVVGAWSDNPEPETLATATVRELSGMLEGFVSECIERDLKSRIAEANPAYELALMLSHGTKKVNKIRLHIMSNGVLSSKFKEEICEPIGGVPVERHIWDLARLKAIYESTREREAVEIQLDDFGSNGIPCIQAASSEGLRSYLCVIEGGLLADLFERYGSRLLEGNVRSFLGMKGGVNKGIRTTIQDSPSLFFAYNNGIAATAGSVDIESTSGTTYIKALTDLQIVNGGQTTASILRSRKIDKLSLEGVTVQMKLTEVERNRAHDLIPRIAQYANTQNKVAIADFFANHPFHRKIEEISRRLQVPSRSGVRVQSKWFYERSRGQYQYERMYLTESKGKAFDLEYPSSQVINKTELAKYDSVWREKPNWVSLGAQKNFTKFAAQFSPSTTSEQSESEYWETLSPKFGEAYYKEIVALAILWDQAERVVTSGKGSWYAGDYRPQIVAYALALMFYQLRKNGSQFDLGRVWNAQEIDGAVRQCIEDCAVAAQDIILNPPHGSSHVGEWTKKETCWEKVSQLQIGSVVKLDWTVTKAQHAAAKQQAKKQGVQDDGIDLQATVYDLCARGYWANLAMWPKTSSLITPDDKKLLARASTVSGVMKINVEKDWKRLMGMKQVCEEEGFRHSK